MRAVIQRVTKSKVEVAGVPAQEIGAGLLVLLGVGADDTAEDVQWLSRKIAALRIFSDEQGLMNYSVADIGGDVMVISQFTLFAQTKKGNRPAFLKSAEPEKAHTLYADFVAALTDLLQKPVATGQFGKHMEVTLLNDGPVTIVIDTKSKE